MAAEKNTLVREAEQFREELQQYFVHSAMECPYGRPYQAVYNQALFNTMPDFLMESYLASGYRRNGNVIYNMHCRGCASCVPIRVDPLLFKPSRSQMRAWKRNQDVSVAITPLSCSDENLALLEKFLRTRYPGRSSSALDYYSTFFINHITNTVEFSYRLGSQLVGVSIVDLSAAWLNVVFFYFDPAQAKRSPGTYNILYLIDFCRRKEIEFLYLGYWIKEVKAMRYKANFTPHYVFRDDSWQLVS